mgnify:CR=1 FL=1
MKVDSPEEINKPEKIDYRGTAIIWKREKSVWVPEMMPTFYLYKEKKESLL